MVAQADGQPNQEQSPTNLWRPGETVLDVHHFAPSATGTFTKGTLLIGLYDPQSGERLIATQGGVTLPNNAFAPGTGQ